MFISESPTVGIVLFKAIRKSMAHAFVNTTFSLFVKEQFINLQTFCHFNPAIYHLLIIIIKYN